MPDGWVITQTIATVIGLGAILVASFALVTERIRLVRGRDELLKATDPGKMRYFYIERLGWWATLMGKETPMPYMTTISGLIEAGDRGFWTTAALDRIPEGHSDIGWVPLYASVFEEVSVSNVREAVNWESTWPFYRSIMERIKSPATEPAIRHKKEWWKLYGPDGKLVQCCRPLNAAQSMLTAGEKRAGQANRGLGNVRPTWPVSRKPSIQVTREELIALALVIGASIKIHEYTETLTGIGAFGLSLYAIPNSGSWNLGLTQGPRIPRHAATNGSGYTTLMAKHLACGSIPFAQNRGWVKSVYLKRSVLEAIKNGKNIRDVSAYGGPTLELLRMLPAEKSVDAYYGVWDEDEDASEEGVGRILRPCKNNTKWDTIGTWPNAVAGIAFGGLVPQVFPHVADAVQFTCQGEEDEGNDRVISELEHLIDKLHDRQHPNISNVPSHPDDCSSCIFGEYVRERVEAKRLVDYVNYMFPARQSNSRAAASVFARYSNLLDHLVTLCDFQCPPLGQIVHLAQGPDAVIKQDDCSSLLGLHAGLTHRTVHSTTPAQPHAMTSAPRTSVSTDISGNRTSMGSSQDVASASSTSTQTAITEPTPHSDSQTRTKPQSSEEDVNPVDQLFEATCSLLRSVYDFKVGEPDKSDSNSAHDFVRTPNLAATLSRIVANRIPEDENAAVEKPFNGEEAAFIVRCILVAWSRQVPHIELIKPTEEDQRAGAPVRSEQNGRSKERGRIATIDELPPVLVFG